MGREAVRLATTTPLDTGTTFTSDWEDVAAYGCLVLGLKTDQDGTFYVDYSPDANNVDNTITCNYDASGMTEPHRFTNTRRYARIRFTNDSGTNQTYLRLQVLLGEHPHRGVATDRVIPREFDATIVRPTDFFLEITEGLIEKWEHVNKFGRNANVGTATTPEDVWHGGSNYTGHPTSYTPETVEAFSSDANDTSAGTGARTLEIFGLRTSTSEEYTSETITLSGVTPVASTNTWWRVNRAIVRSAGTSGHNEGILTVRPTTTTAAVMAQLPATYNQTQIMAWTVPANRVAYLKRFRCSITRASGAAGSATISFRVREDETQPFRSEFVYEAQTGGPVSVGYDVMTFLPAGADVKVRVDAVSDNGTIVDAQVDFILKVVV